MLNLHTHSVYTYEDSILKIEDLVDFSLKNGVKSFCITDSDSLTCLIKAFALAKKKNLTFIPGYEVYIKPDDSIIKSKINEEKSFLRKELGLKRTTKEQAKEYNDRLSILEKINSCEDHKLVLLANNQTGLNNLIRIYNSKGEFGTLNDTIFSFKEGIIVLSGGFESEIMYYISNKNFKKAEEIMLKFKEEFGKDFFIQLEYNYIEVENEFNSLGEVESYKKMIEIARKNEIGIVISNDVRYSYASEKVNYNLFRGIYNKAKATHSSDKNYLMTKDEFVENLSKVYPIDVIEEGINNVNLIEKNIEEMFFQKADGLKDFSKELREKVILGWNRLRKGTKREQESKERYEFELEVIEKKNFTEYFIKVLNIVDTAKSLNILIGPGRGSGCGSEICFLIGITDVDPLQYGLFFERFLNPGRNNFPDIDIDMSNTPLDSNEPSRNLLVDELLKRGIFKFSGYIQNEVTTSTLILFKGLARYYELPFYQSNKISTDSKYIEKLAENSYTGWLKEAVESFGFGWEDEWSLIDKYMPFCYDLGKMPHNTSIAASGVILADETLLPERGGQIGFNGHDLENSDYIKYDLLSIGTLNQILYFEGMNVDWNNNDDQSVWEAISKGETDFVFQLAGAGMTKTILDTKPKSILDLAEISAINRPGPLNMGLVDKYVDLKNGKKPKMSQEEVVLSDILKKEFGEDHSGMVIFQEDLMKICQVGANFTLSEADDIRKGMGKKKVEILQAFKPKFVANWKFGGDPSAIWNEFEKFGEYAFNKSHAVAYSLISYQTAKLWVHHKEKLMEYNLNMKTDKFDASINICKYNLKYKFEFPTIFDMDRQNFEITDKKVCLPGNAERNFDSYVDFLFGDYRGIANLIYKGVCDNLTKDRIALVELVTSITEKIKSNALFMEPKDEKFNNLEQILNGLKICGGITEFGKTSDGILVKINKTRGKNKEILFHDGFCEYNRLNMMKFDLKHFNVVRNGVISEAPYVNTEMIEKTLNRIKEQKPGSAYYAMRDKLSSYMSEYFSSEFKSTFKDIYAIFEDYIDYGKSYKVLLIFRDKKDFFYMKADDNSLKIKKYDKKSLVKLTLKYSPFIKKSTETFIYDFDIIEIEQVVEKAIEQEEVEDV